MAKKPTVFVTGASKGVGLAIARILLTKFQANVVNFSRSKTPELSALVGEHPDSFLSVQGDVTDAEALTAAIAQSIQAFGGLDGLILNHATVEPLGRIASPDITLSTWKNVFDVNFFSLVTAVQAAITELRKSERGGRIVMITSGASTRGPAGTAPYNASKAALDGFARTLAAEEPEIVTVALLPGEVDTGMQSTIRKQGPEHMDPGLVQYFVGEYEAGRLLRPEDPGHVAASLSLNAPKSLSGTVTAWNSEECKPFSGQ